MQLTFNICLLRPQECCSPQPSLWPPHILISIVRDHVLIRTESEYTNKHTPDHRIKPDNTTTSSTTMSTQSTSSRESSVSSSSSRDIIEGKRKRDSTISTTVSYPRSVMYGSISMFTLQLQDMALARRRKRARSSILKWGDFAEEPLENPDFQEFIRKRMRARDDLHWNPHGEVNGFLHSCENLS